ncbi:MAG: hypothetical protein R3A50_05250 [Saprospiraceae bacterium]
MREYPSKLLLFGEHILLQGAVALSYPVKTFSGKWVFRENPINHPPDSRLLQFAESKQLMNVPHLNVEKFIEELRAGLEFKSSIPEGYGLGSSGALCAAVFDRFCSNKTSDLQLLKQTLSQMECHFHGQSSGIDPLTSFVGQPLQIRNKTEVKVAQPEGWKQEPMVFLLDSGLPRNTGTMVNWFLEKCKEEDFNLRITQEYIPLNEQLVNAWLNGNDQEFWPYLRMLSKFQFELFGPMIPETTREMWKETIGTDKVTLKICGAGGGGFVLGFSNSKDNIEHLKSRFKVYYPF